MGFPILALISIFENSGHIEISFKVKALTFSENSIRLMNLQWENDLTRE